jgi:hypothetical protein
MLNATYYEPVFKVVDVDNGVPHAARATLQHLLVRLVHCKHQLPLELRQDIALPDITVHSIPSNKHARYSCSLLYRSHTLRFHVRYVIF